MVYKPKYSYLEDKEILQKEILLHKGKDSISETESVDKPLIQINFKRAENEIKHAETIFKISSSSKLKKELELLDSDTFYSGVIAHAYYAIFFAAKALLLKRKVTTKSPNVHKATLDAFSYYLIINGRLDFELLNIYKSTMVKADALLGLLITEKEKRGNFTYKELPDANRAPAEDSIKNALVFLKHAKKLLEM